MLEQLLLGNRHYYFSELCNNLYVNMFSKISNVKYVTL